jgi:hypothetical protein
MRFPKSAYDDDSDLVISANADLYREFVSRIEGRAREIGAEQELASDPQLFGDLVDPRHVEMHERSKSAVLTKRAERIAHIDLICSSLAVDGAERRFLISRLVDAELAATASNWEPPTLAEIRSTLEEYRRGDA